MSKKLPFSLIISDLHLNKERTDAVKCFMSFMETLAPKAEKLFILGDFFEFWLGDDDKSDFNQKIIKTLKKLSAQGVKLYFMHGNRDFLIGKTFVLGAGMTLLKDPCVMDFYGQRILLSHGDLFCTDDIAYQRFRKICHVKALQWLLLGLPLAIRLKIVLFMRRKSAAQRKPVEITDVNEQAVLDAFQIHNTDVIIHGHTHRLKKHDYPLHNTQKYRYVLGDWHASGSALKVDSTGIEFIEVV